MMKIKIKRSERCICTDEKNGHGNMESSRTEIQPIAAGARLNARHPKNLPQAGEWLMESSRCREIRGGMDKWLCYGHIGFQSLCVAVRFGKYFFMVSR